MYKFNEFKCNFNEKKKEEKSSLYFKHFEIYLFKHFSSFESKNFRKTMTSVKKCNTCESLEATKRCSACLKVAYCSQACQKEDWKSHRLVCTKNATVVLVEGEEFVEKRVDLEEMSSANGWTECEVTQLFGIRLKYKRMPGLLKPGAKEIARVLLVEPDRTLLSGPIDIKSDPGTQYHRILVSDAYTGARKDFVWSDRAWKILNHTKSLGPLMFARADKSDFSRELFCDLVNYTYDMMEYYHHGKAFVVGIRKNKEFATPQEFQKHVRYMTSELREECMEMNLKKFPECTSNQENWFANSDFFKNSQVINL